MAEPLIRSSVPDQVFARLCDAILGGGYAPGERLPTQRALAADLGVIMNSVREVYLPRMGAFGGIIARRDAWAPLYERAAAAIRAGDGNAAAKAVRELATEQENAMLGAP